MKKCMKAVAILVIIICTVGIFSVISLAGDSNSGSSGGITPGGPQLDTPIVTTHTFAWKVSLYVGPKSASLSKTSPASDFSLKQTIIYINNTVDNRWESGNTPVPDMYVGNSNKIGYLNGTSFSPSSNWYGFRRINNAGVPDIFLGSGQENSWGRVKSFFENYDRVRDIDSSVNEKDPWLLIYEPMLFASRKIYNSSGVHTGNVFTLFTASEYAMAQSYSSDEWSYNYRQNSINTYVHYNLASFVALQYSGWLGVGGNTESDVSGSYGWKIPDYYSYSALEAIKLYGGAGMYFSKYFDKPDFTVSNIICDANPLENSTMDITAKVSTTKIGYNPVSCDLYVGGVKMPSSSVDLTSAESATVTFNDIDVGAFGKKDVEVRVNPGNNPEENDPSNNTSTITINVRRPNFTVNLSVSNENPYEAEEIIVTATVNLDLSGSQTPFSSKVDVTLNYNGQEYALVAGAETQTVDLSSFKRPLRLHGD